MAYILVVDDDEIVAEHASRLLMDLGHAGGWVSDAEAAWKLVRQRKPDLILLDHHLPGENGSGFLRRLRSDPENYDVPVIMLTGAQDIKQEQIAYFHGAQDYVRKPFTDTMLAFRVRKVLAARERRAGRSGHPDAVEQRSQRLGTAPLRMI